MQTLLEYARTEGVGTVQGEVLAENATMLRMCAELGFSVSASPNDWNVRVVKRRIAPTAP